MPTKAQRYIAFGKQSVLGTAVAATAKLMGWDGDEGSFHPVNDVQMMKEYRGTLAPAYQAALMKQHTEGTVPGFLTYEDILYWLEGVFGPVTPSGTAAPYTWTYSAPVDDATAGTTPRIYTIEDCVPSYDYKHTGVLLKTLNISGTVGSFPKISSDAIAWNTSALASRADLADRTVYPALMSQVGLYVDTWAGTMGSTAVTSSLKEFELDVDTFRHLKWFDGSVNPSNYGDNFWSGTLRLLLEFNSTQKTLFETLIGTTIQQRQVELRFTDTPRSLKIQFAGTYTDVPTMWEDDEGNITTEFMLSGTYHTTFANWLKIIPVNAVASLT